MSLFFIKEMNVKENILKEQKDLKILEKGYFIQIF